MNNFTFLSPTRLVVGRDAETETAEWIHRYGGSRVLVHHDSGYLKQSGFIDKVISLLRADNLEVVELGGVVPNPHLSLVYEGIRICREKNINFLLAVGGGSVIDSCKAIAMQRGGSPSAYDRVLATQFGAYAAKLVAEDTYGVAVAMVNNKVVSNPLPEIAGKSKLVPADCPMLDIARSMGISLG